MTGACEGERGAARARILEAVHRQRDVTLAGSWQRGDFHLSHATSVSFSDLDLITEHPVISLDAVRDNIIADILPMQITKISIHPQSSFSGLSLQDGFILNIAEYVCSLLAPSAPEYKDYSRAKFALRLCRLSDDECMADTVLRLGSETARRALRVKLGYSQMFDKEAAGALVATHCRADAECRRVALRLLDCVRSDDVVDLLRQLQRCTSMSNWLREYQSAKLRKAAASHGQTSYE